jgi:hypothetical protein
VVVADLSGFAADGPLDGLWVTARSDPFLAVDKAAGKAWVYRRHQDGSWQVDTAHDNTLQYPHGTATGERALDWKRLQAAGEASTPDIIAVQQ